MEYQTKKPPQILKRLNLTPKNLLCLLPSTLCQALYHLLSMNNSIFLLLVTNHRM